MTATAAPVRSFPVARAVDAPQFDKLKIHMVGVGGCGMSGLAAMLLRRGAAISGTDRAASAELDRLERAGARVSTRQGPDSIPASVDLVVLSAAIPDDHPERLAALRRGLTVLKYADLLGMVMNCYRGVAISGTHGKSTTTAWTTHILRTAGLSPSFVVGAGVSQLGGGSGVGDGPHFVAEACEFDRSFLKLTPSIAAVLNIEEDHLDYYRDLAAIREAFAAFVRRVPTEGAVVLNAADVSCRQVATAAAAPIIWFGDAPDSEYRAEDLAVQGGRYAFTLVRGAARLARVKLSLFGRHNVDNALAASALAMHCGVSWDALAAGLESFRGADRRFELRGDVGGVSVLDDYAHHPTEIRATLAAARERFPNGRIWCVFQPHQHSRTRFLLSDFAASFADADEVVVPEIYFVRDSEREKELVNASVLVSRIAANGGRARHVADFRAIVDLLAAQTRPGDAVITMGAGNIWRVADELVQRLGGDLPRA